MSMELSAMKGFLRLMHTPLGYDPHHVMSVGIPLHENSYTTWAARGAYFEQLRAKVAETPGVTMAAISTNATPPRNGWNSRFEILGQPAVEQQTFDGFAAFRGQCEFLEEDFSNIEAVNRGVKSRGFRDVVLNPVQEVGVTHFHAMLARFLRSDGE